MSLLSQILDTRHFISPTPSALSPLHPQKREASSSLHFAPRLRDNGIKSIKLSRASTPTDRSITQEALHNQEAVQPIPEGSEALFTKGDPMAVLLIPESMSETQVNFDTEMLDAPWMPDFDEAAIDLGGTGDGEGEGVDLRKELIEVWKEFRESQNRIGRKIKRLMEMVYQEV